MEDDPYILKSSFLAHSADVRVVKSAFVPEGALITGSRDLLVKVWTPDELTDSFKGAYSMSGPTGFVSSLCTLPASKQYPTGLILAGSNDCSIYGFTLESTKPVLRLLGHSDTVCSLSNGNFGTVVSGSWDKTAKVWSGQQCVLTLHGHKEAVWAVEMFDTQNLTLTGSADKTIRLWHSGKCEKIFTGHEDCVRGLAVISEKRFLSCSNDCTVRLWETSGPCIKVFTGHTDYIYGITLLNNGEDFATCGEDQKVKIWENGACSQTLFVRSKSLWSIAYMKNGDLAVGSSSGTVYMFARKSLCKGDQATVQGITSKLPKDLNLSILPSLEALKNPGTTDGETLMCTDNNIVYLYQWNASKSEWENQGTVEGTNSDETSPEPTPTHDYVFSIDVEGVVFQLPYNVKDNPWFVARQFVDEHNLDAGFINQIADHIIVNSVDKGSSKEASASDPFTGACRYIPGQRGSLDVSSQHQVSETATVSTNNYFPKTSFVEFHSSNMEGLQSKLLEFSECVSADKKLTTEEIAQLLLLSDFPDEVNDDQMNLLERTMTWDDEYLFPALDLLRLAVRCKAMHVKIGNAGVRGIVNHLLQIFNSSTSVKNRMLVVRTFCNLFGYDEGEDLLKELQEKICSSVKDILPTEYKPIQVAIASLYLNYSISAHRGVELNVNNFSVNIVEMLALISDPEAVFRTLVCIGTLIEDPLAKALISSLEINTLLNGFRDLGMSKINDCVDLLLAVFSS